MRVLVISDVHANLVALEEVLVDAERVAWGDGRGFDAVWSLGDIVGYGPRPNECIRRLQQFDGHLRVAGNHDWAVLGRIDIDEFNPEARKSVLWTRQQLDSASLAYLERVPDHPIRPASGGDFTITHASPRHPVWEYIYNKAVASENFAYFESRYCLVGHTHVPRIYRSAPDPETGRLACTAYAPVEDQDINISDLHRLILNPGSVGQPRDKDARAAYALLDTERETMHFRRVRYDFEITQSQMRQAGLPERLIARLAYGW
jgi:predicted phosphodiesterase